MHSGSAPRPPSGAPPRALRAEPTRNLSESRRRFETARLLSRARASRGEARTAYEDEVIQVNMCVASDVARRYYGRGISAEDLDQVAYLGLVKAVRGFDPTLGDDFLSYAVPTLRGEVRRHFRDAGWTVRPPRSVQEAQPRVSAAEGELSQRLGRRPRPSEIAVHVNLPLSLVVDSLSAGGCFSPLSLDMPAAEGEKAPGHDLGDLDPAFASTEARLALKPLMENLSERDRAIIHLRYYENRTQAQIGAQVGVTQEQVSRLLSGILLKMRRTLVA